MTWCKALMSQRVYNNVHKDGRALSDIFISYSIEDLGRVKPLVRALEALGWSVWWDRTILPSRVWHQVIEESHDAAACVIVFWSNTSISDDRTLKVWDLKATM